MVTQNMAASAIYAKSLMAHNMLFDIKYPQSFAKLEYKVHLCNIRTKLAFFLCNTTDINCKEVQRP